MRIYNQTTNRSSPAKSDGQADFPILKKHWPDFAAEAAATELGGSRVHPADRAFVDREPPHIPAPADKQEDPDIVAVLRARQRAA